MKETPRHVTAVSWGLLVPLAESCVDSVSSRATTCHDSLPSSRGLRLRCPAAGGVFRLCPATSQSVHRGRIPR
jgi:hypothetical protein